MNRSRNFERAVFLAKKYDNIEPGYVPIHITAAEHNASNRFYKYPLGVPSTTVGDALKDLNLPRRLLSTPYTSLTAYDVNECSKLGFLIKTLTRIRNGECNLDVAIIVSNRQTETLLVNVLNLYDFQFKPLSQCFDKLPPVLGALVRFRKTKPTDKAPNFRLSVDYVIAYDTACIVDHNFVDHFQGVYYTKPQVVKLACERTADLRICNFRDTHPNKVVNGLTSLEQPEFATAALFCHLIAYPKIKLADRVLINDDRSTQLVSWMLRKENTAFKVNITNPHSPSFQSAVPAKAGKSAVTSGKRRASEITDAAASNVPPKRVATGHERPKFNHHRPPPQRIALLRSRIQTSFPVKTLKFPSLILDENVLKGVDWLSSRTLIKVKRNNLSISEVTPTSYSGNVGSSSHTRSDQSPSSYNTMSNASPVSYAPSSSVAPSIHPSRLAMIEASQQPLPYPSLPTPHTQTQERSMNNEPSSNQDQTKMSIPSIESSMKTGSEENTVAGMTPQNVSQTHTQDSIQDSVGLKDDADVNNDTSDDTPMEVNRLDLQENSDKSAEDSPQTEQESSEGDGLNDFEMALERAHLELMRSLLGKGDEE